MAITTITEGDAAAAQYTDETRAALRLTLIEPDNLAVLLAGTGGDVVTNIHIGTRRKEAIYPVVYIAHLGTDEDDHELGNVRELRQRFRLYVYQRGPKTDGTVEAQVADLADRIKAVLNANRNRSADGLWYYLRCGRLVTGPAPSDSAATKIWAAHIDVLCLRSVGG